MKTSQITFLGLALFLAVQSSAGHHLPNCGLGSGTDACGCSEVVVKAARPSRPVVFADPYVIKEATSVKSPPARTGCGSLLSPQRKHSGPSVTDLLRQPCGPIAPRFQPIGDLCTSCKKSITEVVPAYPGKPICNACAAKYESCDGAYTAPESYTRITNPNTELNTFDDDCLSFDEQESIYNAQFTSGVPADPVSLSLAYNLARKSQKPVREGALSFGQRTDPIDGSFRKTVDNIPEEKLSNIERPVVELISPFNGGSSAAYEEVLAQQAALEQKRLALEAQAEANSASQLIPISYGALGYQLVKSTGNNFVSTITRQESVASDPADDLPCGPIGQPMPGYVSGNVIIRDEAGQESTSDYYGGDSYGQDSYEQDSYGSDSSEESESYVRSGGLLERLRASARAQTGCGCSN